GTGNTKLASNSTSFTRNITWSPSGDQVAYIGNGPNQTPLRSIFIANADGSGIAPLPNSPTSLTSVDWSPDGSKFVYATDREIFLMNLDGSQRTQLTFVQQTSDGPTTDSDP